MDATTFRWVLVVIAIAVVLVIYLFGQYQARLRRRNAIDTFTREEIDSAFTEDEQLRVELDNLNQMLQGQGGAAEENLDGLRINPAEDAPSTPYALPDPEIFVPAWLENKDEDRLISYHLRHGDFRLITAEEIAEAASNSGLQTSAEGLLECVEGGELAFQVASLSGPGYFTDLDSLDYSTLGLNCFIDLDINENPRRGYETMLKKVDELVRCLNVKVFKPNRELLTISDVTATRQRLG